MKGAVEEWMSYSFPWNLIGVVCTEDPKGLKRAHDISLAVEYVLGNLAEEERAVLRLRFEKHMRPTEVGEELNLKTQEIRKIEGRSIRTLRCPEWRRYLELGYQEGCLATLDVELRESYDRQEVAKILSLSSEVHSLYEIEDSSRRIEAILVRSFFFDISKVGLRIAEYPWLLENHITYIWQLCLLKREHITGFTRRKEDVAKVEQALARFRLQLDDGTLSGNPDIMPLAEKRYIELAGPLRF